MIPVQLSSRGRYEVQGRERTTATYRTASRDDQGDNIKRGYISAGGLGAVLEGGSSMERRFTRRIDVLDKIAAVVYEFAAQNGVSDSVAFKLNLAIEELFVNSVKYNPQNRNDILITLSKDADRLIVSLTDFDVEPFDITKADEYDNSQPLERRRIGGLGIHLVRRIADQLSYEYKNRQSRVTLIKDLGKANV
jgi:serine/threonine-protein kinase RsbW